MNNRVEFIKKGEDILDFVDTYGVLRCDCLEKFFKDSNKIVSYLIKNRRLHKSLDGRYIGADQNPHPDKCMTAALNVLADVFEKVQNHARAETPAQISFATHAGECYEIVYVGYGMEAMVAATSQFKMDSMIKRIIIIEDKNQMTRLQIPGTTRFALIHPDGSLSYFRGG